MKTVGTFFNIDWISLKYSHKKLSFIVMLAINYLLISLYAISNDRIKNQVVDFMLSPAVVLFTVGSLTLFLSAKLLNFSIPSKLNSADDYADFKKKYAPLAITSSSRKEIEAWLEKKIGANFDRKSEEDIMANYYVELCMSNMPSRVLVRVLNVIGMVIISFSDLVVIIDILKH